jgi:hyperosmotically inducible periplasmic protein
MGCESPEKEIGMKRSMKLLSSGLFLLFALGMAACSKPGPAERAGEQLDQSVTDASKKINETADKVGEKIDAQGAKTAIAIDDSKITAKIKAAFMVEPGLKTLRISVITKKGVVVLSGSVDSQANSDRARALAGAVAGVKEVVNQLAITPIN